MLNSAAKMGNAKTEMMETWLMLTFENTESAVLYRAVLVVESSESREKPKVRR